MPLCWILTAFIVIGVIVNGRNAHDFTSKIAIKYIEVTNINELSFEDRARIFEPTTYLSSSKTAQHNIHIFDEFGKFIKLKYNSKHENHINIFELKANSKNNIKSVQCRNDTENSIKIKFNDQISVDKYNKDINNHINSDKYENEYFVTGSSFWKCYNKKERQYTPILRKIISSKISNDSAQNTLILTTKYAKYTDLFQYLQMELETNANMHQSQKKSIIESRRKLLCSKNTNNHRVLLCDDIPKGTSFWGSMVNSITSFFNSITSLISDIADYVETLEDIYQEATELMDALSSGYYTKHISDYTSWQYNYPGYGYKASKQLDLTDHVTCKNCYAFADLTYTLKMHIDDYELSYFYLVGDGKIKLKVDIEASTSYKDEFSVKTCELKVPYLSFSIVGIHFGFHIYGEYAVGVDFSEAVKYNFWLKGSLKRGIEYDAANNKQRYIGSHSFYYGSIGPILDFKDTSISLYARATLYLVLSLVGNVYIGVQPKYSVEVTDYSYYGGSSGCAVYYTPSATATVFVGASIDLANIYQVWSKKTWITPYALDTDDGGCVTHSEVTALDEWVNAENSYSWSWRRRRRMLAFDSNTTTIDPNTEFIVNYTSPKIAYDLTYQWGKYNTMWHANLTTLNKTCYDWYHSNYDTDSIPFDAALPNSGHLMIYPQDNNGSTLYGIYTTINSISSRDGYLITTNVTCISRYIFTKVIDHDSSLSTVHHRFNVSLMDNDYHCDVNESVFLSNNNLKIDEWHIQTQLPKQMDAILMDSAFGTIILTDIDNCHIFPLTKGKELHHFNYDNNVTSFIEKLTTSNTQNISYTLPSKTWFGSFHCEYDDDGEDNDHLHISDSLTLYFNSVDWINGNVNATLLINENETASAVGHINYDELTLDFTVFSNKNGKFILNMHGFVTVLQDGSLLYFGVIPSDIHKCTGFIFQGMIDMKQFDQYNDQVMVETDCNNNNDANITLFAVEFILVGLGIAALLLFAVYLFIKCNGYSLSISKLHSTQNSYQLMDDNL